MGPRSSSLRLTLLPFVDDGMGGSAYFEQIVSVAETDQLASRSSIASIALAFEIAVRLPMGSAPSRGAERQRCYAFSNDLPVAIRGRASRSHAASRARPGRTAA